MAPKLSDKHIILAPCSKMGVNLAVQVLSHSVAAGISTLVSLGHLPKEAEHTAIFIDHFDKLFNAFNSRSLKSKQPMGHGLSEKTSHAKFLKDSLLYLENVHIPSKKELPCLNGWKLSINALLGLWDDLHSNHKSKFLLTNRLNQDCLENLFSIIRGRGGHQFNPNAEQFKGAFRHIVVEKLFIQSLSSNCKVDFDKILLDISVMSPKSKKSHPKQATSSSVPDYRTEEISEILKCSSLIALSTPPCNLTENIATYMAGYLLKRFPLDKCSTCFEDCMRGDDVGERFNFIDKKAYVEKSGLVFPNEIFAILVDELENLFNIVFPFVMHTGNILRELMHHVHNICKSFGRCINTECKDRILKTALLYMKIQIHHAVKTSQTGSTGGDGK